MSQRKCGIESQQERHITIDACTTNNEISREKCYKKEVKFLIL